MAFSKPKFFFCQLLLIGFSATFIVAANFGKLQISKLGTIKTGGFGTGAAEISAYDPQSERIFTTNAEIKVSTALAQTNADSQYTKLFSFGARSFSIIHPSGNMIYDSGDDFEQITAQICPENFNSDNESNNSFDSRSDDKGPEPETFALGRLWGKTYAFIGLERIGGIMVMTLPTLTRWNSLLMSTIEIFQQILSP